MSPTARSLALLRAEGWLAGIVERRNPKLPHVTHDLYGFADVLVVRDGEVRFVQATTASNLTSRIKKAFALETFRQLQAWGFVVEFWGWRKGGAVGTRKTWRCDRRVYRFGRLQDAAAEQRRQRARVAGGGGA